MESLNYKYVAAEMRYDGMDKNLFAVATDGVEQLRLL